MAPQLSILVPVYNEVATVERALDALLAADLPFTTELTSLRPWLSRTRTFTRLTARAMP